MKIKYHVDREDLIQILDDFGKTICENKDEYFSYLITVSSDEGMLLDFSLYIIVAELSYEYRLINVEILDAQTLRIRFFTLATQQAEVYDVSIAEGTGMYQHVLFAISNLKLFKGALESLIVQVKTKKEFKTPIIDRIIPGQARVAVLKDGQQINVGWIEIVGDEVFYYTGQGLREMWKPNMTAQEQSIANHLKTLRREELMASGHIQKRKIDEFEDLI